MNYLVTLLGRRWLWATVAGVLLLAAALPTIVCRSGWVEQVLNRRLAAQDLTATVGHLRIGWLRSLELRDVQIRDAREQWQLTAARLDGDRSLGQLLWDRQDLGVFTIERPTLEISIDRPFVWPAPAPPRATEDDGALARLSNIGLRIHDGTILTRSQPGAEPQPVAAQINLAARLTRSDTGKVLTIEPGQPLDHVSLTPEMCDLGLKYVAPILADAAWTRGQLSLQLTECRLHLNDMTASQVKGQVTLHAVETGLRSPVAITIAQAVATATQRKLPEAVRIADESIVEFQLEAGRVSHTGLAFGLPEISPELVIRTEGSVGLDRSLDLLAEIPLPLQLLGDGPLATALGNQTLRLPIRGTFDQPEIKLEGDGQMVSELLSGLIDPALQGDVQLDNVVDALKQLRQDNQQRRQERAPLFPRLRGRRSAGP